MLTFCELQDGRHAEMSTRVPNEDVAITAMCLTQEVASGDSSARVIHKGGRILSVTGVYFSNDLNRRGNGVSRLSWHLRQATSRLASMFQVAV